MSGTPKTIPELVQNEIYAENLSTLEHRLIHGFKDYLAQGFGVSMLQHEQCAEILKELFDRITKDIK